jgi:hypothetical protein
MAHMPVLTELEKLDHWAKEVNYQFAGNSTISSSKLMLMSVVKLYKTSWQYSLIMKKQFWIVSIPINNSHMTSTCYWNNDINNIYFNKNLGHPWLSFYKSHSHAWKPQHSSKLFLKFFD